jgi:hypothetical protein
LLFVAFSLVSSGIVGCGDDSSGQPAGEADATVDGSGGGGGTDIVEADTRSDAGGTDAEDRDAEDRDAIEADTGVDGVDRTDTSEVDTESEDADTLDTTDGGDPGDAETDVDIEAELARCSELCETIGACESFTAICGDDFGSSCQTRVCTEDGDLASIRGTLLAISPGCDADQSILDLFETRCAETCVDECEDGSSQCNGSDVETCTVGVDGCFDWTNEVACGGRQSCDDDSGAAVCVCDDECTVGANSCSDSTFTDCEIDSDGCAYTVATDCTAALPAGVCLSDGLDSTCATPISTTTVDCGGTVQLTGELDASSDVWNRFTERCESNPTPGDHRYQVWPITNSSIARQWVSVNATWSGFDGYLHAFRAPFDLADQDGCIAGNDDTAPGATTLSTLRNLELAPGEVIYLVASAFEPGDISGSYTLDLVTEGSEYTRRANYSIDGLQMNRVAVFRSDVTFGSGLTSLPEAYPCLREIGGSLIFDDTEIFVHPSFPRLETVGGSVVFDSNSNLERIEGFPVLETVGNDIIASLNNNLTNVTAFTNVEVLGSNLWLYGNGALSNISGLSGIRAIGASTTGFCSLWSVGGMRGCDRSLVITNSDLINLSTFSNLVSIGGGVRITLNDRLTSLDGLQSLRALGAWDTESIGYRYPFEITDNAVLSNITQLYNITSVTNTGTNFEVSDNPVLCSVFVDAMLSKLREFDGFVTVLGSLRNGALNLSCP